MKDLNLYHFLFHLTVSQPVRPALPPHTLSYTPLVVTQPSSAYKTICITLLVWAATDYFVIIRRAQQL